MGGPLIARLRCPQCVGETLRRLARNIRAGRVRRVAHACGSGWAALVSEHPVEHSRLLGTCIDVGVIRAVEAVNVSVCPTLFSCQGDPRGSGGRDWPGITIPGGHWPTMRAWLTARGLGWSEHATERDAGGRWTLVPPIGHDDRPIAVWAAGTRPGDGNTHLEFRGVGIDEVFDPIMPGPGR